MISNKDVSVQYNTFSTNIKKYRKINNLTQEQLAELADISISYIKQIESGNEYKNVSLTVILKLCKALNVSPNVLFYKK